jgi:hypothetical protein
MVDSIVKTARASTILVSRSLVLREHSVVRVNAQRARKIRSLHRPAKAAKTKAEQAKAAQAKAAQAKAAQASRWSMLRRMEASKGS